MTLASIVNQIARLLKFGPLVFAPRVGLFPICFRFVPRGWKHVTCVTSAVTGVFRFVPRISEKTFPAKYRKYTKERVSRKVRKEKTCAV